jgi:flagellar motor switch/type III secretory pathway protein FliN
VGRARVSLARLAELAPGDVLTLDRTVGSPFDLISRGVLLGSVEPVVADDAVAYKLVSPAERDDAAAD